MNCMKSDDSTFCHTYQAYHKLELKLVGCIEWKILQQTNPALRFVWSFLVCFNILFLFA